MSAQNHRTCERCWFDDPAKVLPGGALRFPSQVTDSDPGICCFCGGVTITGIFQRRDPSDPALRCAGEHHVRRWAKVAFSETSTVRITP